MMSKKSFCAGLLCLLGLAGYSQDRPLPLDPAVRAGKLKNGFTYYIRHNTEPENRVTFYLVNKIGSVLEKDNQRGLAHFMEHMTFNGSKHFPKNELMDYLQGAGVRFGADINAYTGYDETVYQLPIPSDKPEFVKKGIQIMRDWAQDATLAPGEIDKERGVVLEEKRLGKGANDRLKQQYFPVILNHSRYADRSPIGTDDVLKQFKPATIKAFYRDWYRPDLQALIVVGDINAVEMEKMVRLKFADLKNPLNERARIAYAIPLTGKNQFVALTDKEQVSTVAEVIIKHQAAPLKTEGDYRLSVERQLFNGMLAVRFGELSQQASPPFIQANAGIKNLLGNLDSYSTTVVARPGELEAGVKALWRETVRIKKFGFTQSELDRMKTDFLSRVASALMEKNRTASDSYVQEYVDHFLRNRASAGIDVEYKLIQKYLPGITLNDMNSLVKTYLTATNRDVIILAPDKEKDQLPGKEMFLSWMEAVNGKDLQPYHDMVNQQSLLITEPVAGKIVKKETDQKLGVTTIKLQNGVTVLLKPTDFKNDEILFNAESPGGTSLYTDREYPSAANAAAIIAAGGAGNYSATELDKFLTGKQLDVRPFIGERNQGIYGGSSNKDLETALQLVYGYLTEPRKDTSVFKSIIARTKARLANRADDPNSVFNDTVSAVLGNNNIRRTGPSLEKIAAIDVDKAYAIYKERFADASQMTFVFTGSFNQVSILPLLEKYLGALPALNAGDQPKDLNIYLPEGIIAKNVYKGSEPKATVMLVYSGTYDYTPANNMKFEALQEALNIRLIERLREQESGVYSPGVTVSPVKYPQQRFNMVIRFGCAPANVDKLIASAKDEVEKLKATGPLPVNVEKWRAEDTRQRELAIKENSWWLNYLSGQLQNSESLQQLFDDDQLQRDANQNNLKAFAEKYLDNKNFIRLVLLPDRLNLK